VNCRYTAKNKKEIFDSRLKPTKLLNRVIVDMVNPPKLFINIASATIYRHAEDHQQDELTGEIGGGFSVAVCQAWERTFFETDTPKTRKVALRTSFVLGASDSALPRLFNLARFGLGGRQGNGEQYVSWIHEDDMARIIEWLADHPEISGVLNGTAPGPVKNKIIMKVIREVLHRPFGLPAPKWLLEIGALLIGTETELILKSRWVIPRRLLESGFKFKYPHINEAIKACI